MIGKLIVLAMIVIGLPMTIRGLWKLQLGTTLVGIYLVALGFFAAVLRIAG